MDEPSPSRTASADPIRHVVLLMLENHSFDQMLSCFQSDYPQLEGVDPSRLRSNADASGCLFTQTPTTEQQMASDPNHDHPDVMEQLSNGNSGFVLNFEKTYPRCTNLEKSYVMGYYPRGALPALHALAQDFLICDHWFASLPGPTWPNRLFALSGTSSGHIEMPEGFPNLDLGNAFKDQTQNTLFDRLAEAQRTWAIYYSDVPDSLLFVHQRTPEQLRHYHRIDDFFTQAAKDEKDFPEFALIEPKYFGLDQDDDHPPHNIMKAEKLIADIYNALRSSAALWSSTLLVVLYDEHGGFYDHLTPPEAIAPDDKTAQYDFKQLGPRVPALLVSPWVQRGYNNRVFDHTSLLKYLTDKWNLGPLGARTAHAQTFATAIQSTPRADNDMIPFIRISYEQLLPQRPSLERSDDSPHHRALHAFADYLKVTEDKIVAGAVEEFSEASDVVVRIKSWIGGILSRGAQCVSAYFETWRTLRQRKTIRTIQRHMKK